MIEFEKIADSILKQLYSVGMLIIPRNDILKNYLEEFGSKVDHKVLQTALKYLEEQDLIQFFPEPGLYNGYSITVKGIILHKSGGIRKKQFNEKVKNILYVVSLIAVIIAGVYYLLAMIELIRCWK